jgi:rubrerythrin
MEYGTFAEALDFAIGREKAAVAFYSELLDTASFAAQKSTLADFRSMEEGHVIKLSAMKERGEVRLSAKAAVDLGLARQLADEETPTAGMTYQDILSAAIRKEERSGSLYRELAQAALESDIKAIFEVLEAEEGRHKLYFERLYEEEVARDN